MTIASEHLLVKFRSKDTPMGVTWGTVNALAKKLDVNETQVIHLALSKFAADHLPAYQPDEGPLKSAQLTALRRDAVQHLPPGKTLHKETLFP